MSEEEIKKIIKEDIVLDYNCYSPISRIELEAIQGLLDLYNKEKERNEKLEWKYKRLEHKYKILRCDYKFTHEMQRRDMIHKCQIIRKIKELSNGTYDAKIILQELLEE